MLRIFAGAENTLQHIISSPGGPLIKEKVPMKLPVDYARLVIEKFFSKCSRVIITRNLWTAGRLVDGSMGNIFDMIWDDLPPYQQHSGK